MADEVMTDRNKNCLRANQEFLANNLTCHSQILLSMEAEDLIYESVRSEIASVSTDQKRNTCFLQWLGKASNRAYEAFLEQLVNTKQTHIANTLKLWGTQSQRGHNKRKQRKRSDKTEELHTMHTSITNRGGFLCLKINILTDDNVDGIVDALGRAIWIRLMSFPHSDLQERTLPDKEIRLIRNFLRQISNFGCQIVHIGRHPPSLVVHCPTIDVAETVLFNIERNILDSLYYGVFGESLKKQFDLKTLQLSVTIDKNEFLFCIRELIGKEGIATVKIEIEGLNYTVNLKEYVLHKLQEGAGTMHESIQECGRVILKTFSGCICIALACPTPNSVRDLKHKCDSGQLASAYQQALLTDEFKERFGLHDLRLQLEIEEWEYKLCLFELEHKGTFEDARLSENKGEGLNVGDIDWRPAFRMMFEEEETSIPSADLRDDNHTDSKCDTATTPGVTSAVEPSTSSTQSEHNDDNAGIASESESGRKGAQPSFEDVPYTKDGAPEDPKLLKKVCNGDQYLFVEPEELHKAWKKKRSRPPMLQAAMEKRALAQGVGTSTTAGALWSSVHSAKDSPCYQTDADSAHSVGDSNNFSLYKINMEYLCLEGGVPLQVDTIPEPVFKRVEMFFVCTTCGKVFWEGAHFERVCEQFSHVLEDGSQVGPPVGSQPAVSGDRETNSRNHSEDVDIVFDPSSDGFYQA